MAAVEGERSRWDVLRHSLRALLPRLPPDDPVSIGSFAENLRWWSTAKSAAETRKHLDSEHALIGSMLGELGLLRK